MVKLNQTYKEKETLKQYPDIAKIKQNYIDFCLNKAKWNKYGRAYDCSISLYNIDFKDKIVAELGARDSIFSSYLTQYVKKVHASDIFIGWGDLGDLTYWDNLWKKFAIEPEKHISEFQDMTRTKYQDDFFDIVVSFSAIEHIPNNGDTLAAKEMARICKPGGKIIIGTEMIGGENTIWHSGGYFYSEKGLFERIIDPMESQIIGDYDFSYENSDKINFNGLEFTSCIFCLEKK